MHIGKTLAEVEVPRKQVMRQKSEYGRFMGEHSGWGGLCGVKGGKLGGKRFVVVQSQQRL